MDDLKHIRPVAFNLNICHLLIHTGSGLFPYSGRLTMSNNRMPKVLTQDIGDADLSYLLYEGEGPPIVLLHATGFLPWLWHPIARELAPGRQVIAPYFCDHRESDPEKGGLNWLTVAQDLAELCKRLGL